MYRLATHGLGDQQSASTALSYGTQGASVAVSGAFAAGLIPASAIPFIGPAIAGAALLASALIKNSGCGATCIQTSQWANQAADALQKNLDAWRALPQKTRSNQALALATFDRIWNQLVAMCSDPQWGNAGKRCISDRQQGACKWKNGNDCWNWFIGYRDPIANDPGVVDDPPLVSASSVSDGASQVSSLFSSSDGSTSWLPIAAVAALVFLAVKL